MSTEFVLTVSEADADDVRLEELTRQLRGELLELDDTESVAALTLGDAPDGTRAGLATAAGALLVAVQPQLGSILKVVGLVRDWLARGNTPKSIKIQVGSDTIELTGASDAVQQQLVADWISRRQQEASVPQPRGETHDAPEASTTAAPGHE